MNDIRLMELGKTWDTYWISRKLRMVVVSDVGSELRCFLCTASDRLRIFPEFLQREISEQAQTRSGVGLEISVRCELRLGAVGDWRIGVRAPFLI